MTDDNIAHLKTVTVPSSPVDQDLVSGLEILLQMAKDGEIQGLAYATIATVGAGSYLHCGSGWRGGGVETNLHTIIGGVRYLEKRLLELLDGT